MANTFNIQTYRGRSPTAKRIFKEIRDRCIECDVPRCWTLKNENDKGQLYLDKKIDADERGRCVQMRRYLFLLIYDAVPDRRQIIMRCGNSRCQNPAHAKVRDWPVTSETVAELIKLNWLTKEQAKEWYNWGS